MSTCKVATRLTREEIALSVTPLALVNMVHFMQGWMESALTNAGVPHGTAKLIGEEAVNKAFLSALNTTEMQGKGSL